ncbi:hypothetical protein HaLaN_04568 [Haematococcus lacustris]|uniref:Uncharacterized protein n=1 Tax=Haematococcus lacustris TaxID=44745 RepID=A0A699YGU7_HAELA|nr:hypothetical protein HaLaN_04568 [Haematococcus lacustris]
MNTSSTRKRKAGVRDRPQPAQQGNKAMAYTPSEVLLRPSRQYCSRRGQASQQPCIFPSMGGGALSHGLLGHVGRGGRSRRGPHEQYTHEFECSDLSRQCAQHNARELMTHASPRSRQSALSGDVRSIIRDHVAGTRRRFDYQG